MGGAAVHAFTSFSSNLVLVRYLAPEEFGRFAIVQANISLVMTIASLHLTTLLLREAPPVYERESRELYLNALAIEVCVVGVLSIAVLGVFGLLDALSIIVLSGMLFSIWMHAQRVMYERRFDYRALTTLEAGAYLASHILSAVGAIVGLGTIVLYVRIWIQGIGQFVSLYRIGGIRGFTLRFLQITEWKQVLRNARTFWLDSVLDQSFERIVMLMTGALAGARATGFLFQAYRLALTPHLIFQPLAERVLFNYLTHHVVPDNRVAVIRKVVVFEALLMSTIAVIVVVLAPLLVPRLFGNAWLPVAQLLQMLGGAVAFATIFSSIRALYKSEGTMTKFITVGRSGQYLPLLAVFIAVAVFGAPPERSIALAVSGSFAVASIAMILSKVLAKRVPISTAQ